MKLREKEELEKMEELRETIEASPLMQQTRANKAAEVLIKRKAAVQAIETLRKEQEENLPKLQNDLKEKEEKYLTAKAMLDKASDEIRTARAATFGENTSFNSAIEIHERVLFDTYDPAIDEAIEFFRDKLDYLRKPGRITKVGRKSENNLISWTKKTNTETNVQAIHDAINYCRDAIKELEKMKLQPELDLLKIQAWKDNIPAIDVYTEYTGKANMPRQAPDIVPPCEYTLGKLIEKVNKHLKTPTKKARI